MRHLERRRDRSRRRKGDKAVAERNLEAKEKRTFDDMCDALNRNMESIKDIFAPYHYLECQMAVLKLLYNMNISPISTEAAEVIRLISQYRHRITRQERGSIERRWLCESPNQCAEAIEISHVRALRNLYAMHTADERLPGGHVLDPVSPYNVIEQQLKTFEYKAIMFDGNIDLSVFDATVYPSHSEIVGPITPSMSSITERYRRSLHRFLRVRFVDKNLKPFKVEELVNAELVIEHRIVVMLQRGLPVPVRRYETWDKEYEFLSYSVSGLKQKKAVWFFISGGHLSANTIRGNIGNWNENDELNRKFARVPSKWGTRLALAFTKSAFAARVSAEEWAWRDDEPDNPEVKLKNTEGCGLISPELWKDANIGLTTNGWMVSHRYFRV